MRSSLDATQQRVTDSSVEAISNVPAGRPSAPPSAPRREDFMPALHRFDGRRPSGDSLSVTKTYDGASAVPFQPMSCDTSVSAPSRPAAANSTYRLPRKSLSGCNEVPATILQFLRRENLPPQILKSILPSALRSGESEAKIECPASMSFETLPTASFEKWAATRKRGSTYEVASLPPALRAGLQSDPSIKQ